MENNIFEKWDSAVNMDDLQKDIQDAAKNNSGSDFKEVPHGTYDVSIEKMELKASKKGDPMVSVWFNILDGEFKNSKIFMNQVIKEGFQIHIVNEFLRSLTKNCAVPNVEFKSYGQYADLIMDIHEMIAEDFEYALEYGVTDKGFNTFKIKKVYALEGDGLPY